MSTTSPPWSHEETREHLPRAIQGDPKAIVAAFDWNKTPEGAAFWREAYQQAKAGALGGKARSRLREMSNEVRGVSYARAS